METIYPETNLSKTIVGVEDVEPTEGIRKNDDVRIRLIAKCPQHGCNQALKMGGIAVGLSNSSEDLMYTYIFKEDVKTLNHWHNETALASKGEHALYIIGLLQLAAENRSCSR